MSTRPTSLDDERVKAALARFHPESSLRRRLGAPMVMLACRALIQVLNRLETDNVEAFREAKSTGRPLLTFSNHTSLFDDPWLVATFSPLSWTRTRWCATDAMNFFDNELSAKFFSFGRGVPIVRGAGLDQMGLHFLEERLREGEWVHIFPEGGRSRQPDQIALPLKTGIGHLVRATRPLLLPFHHQGMADILPIGARVPRIGKRIRLRFGSVTDSDQGLADKTPEAISEWAGEQLVALQNLWAAPSPLST